MEFTYGAGGNGHGCTLWKTLEGPQKIKPRIPMRPSDSTPCYRPKGKEWRSSDACWPSVHGALLHDGRMWLETLRILFIQTGSKELVHVT